MAHGLAGRRIAALEDRRELPLADVTFEPEISGATAQPVAGRLASAEVVVLDPAGNRVQVVALLPSRQFADVEHRIAPKAAKVTYLELLACNASLCNVLWALVQRAARSYR